MTTAKNTQRKNFRCVFNPYVTKENRDAVVRSIISQFEGYYAEPEVTLHDDGFIITVTIGDNLSLSSVRDKILWNQFIDSVTAQDAIRKIQIIRLPKASVMDFGDRIPGQGSVGGFGPAVDPIVGDTGVNEIDGEPHPEYKIDNADRPDGPAFTKTNSLVKHADPTDNGMDEGAAPVFFGHSPDITPQDLDSDPTVLDKENHRSIPEVLGSFKVLSIDGQEGGSFTLNKPNGFQSVGDPPDQGPLHERAFPGTGIGGGAPISGASWYVTQPGNEQGTELGVERNRGDNHDAPISGAIVTGSIEEENEAEDVKSALELPQARGGGQSVPDGGQVEGWFASANFGINEYYDYNGDLDDNDF